MYIKNNTYLLEHASLQPRLDALLIAHQEDLERVNGLEKRIASLLEQHATKVTSIRKGIMDCFLLLFQVDALSELFVAWNDVITDAEDVILKAEREREEQRRLGYD